MVYGNKKDVGETSAAYPSHQAFALPFHRDKQLSQPTPLGIIYNVYYRSCDLQTYGYNTPSMDASLRYLLLDLEVAKFRM